MAEHYMHVCESCNNKYSGRHDPVSVFEGWLLGEELGTPYETRRNAASHMLSNVHRLDKDSWYTGPYGFDALKERGLVDFGQHDRIITDEGIAFVKRMLADPESMPMTAKRAIAEYDVLRDEYAHLFEHDPDMRVRVAMFGVHGLEPVEPPTGIDGFRTDTIYDFKDLDVLSATFAITHLYSGFNPNHHVIVRAHESYTDPPAPVIDSINNRQLRQSGGTRYLKVSRTVLDKEKQ